MKIKFSFEVSTFAEAAIIEELLKKKEVKYKVAIDGNNTVKTKRRKSSVPLRRKRITKIELAAVVLCIKTNPTWNNSIVSKKTNVSNATVGRIREGTHTLQQK